MEPLRIAVIGTGHRATGGSAPPAAIASIVAPGFQAELVETASNVFPGDPDARRLTVQAYVKTGIEAERRGYHALFINTVGDYGLHELRRRVNIPVIGAGLAAMLAARAIAARFAIVTVWPRQLAFIYARLLDEYDMRGCCTDVRYSSEDSAMDSLDDPDNFVERMRRGETDSVSNLAGHCRRAAEDEGAEAIVLGCTCMAPIASLLSAASPVPVIDAMTAGYRMTELALRQLNLERP